jgi:hypothetical protein
MKSKKKIHDPRESLADELSKAGIDAQKAFLIALDTGRNLVDKEYLIDLDLKGKQMKSAENIVKNFYWED